MRNVLRKLIHELIYRSKKMFGFFTTMVMVFTENSSDFQVVYFICVNRSEVCCPVTRRNITGRNRAR